MSGIITAIRRGMMCNVVKFDEFGMGSEVMKSGIACQKGDSFRVDGVRLETRQLRHHSRDSSSACGCDARNWWDLRKFGSHRAPDPPGSSSTPLGSSACEFSCCLSHRHMRA